MALCSALILASASGTALAKTVKVQSTDLLKFEPAKVVIHVGDTVVWHNASVLVHTVTDVPKLAAKAADVALPKGAKPFNSGNLQPKADFRHRFTAPGTYRYFCIPHEAAGMLGEVVVEPK
ncbi:MAG: hypothetical protein KGJ55_05745 [Gammaproteobacteria bacterium]|nr:hypothetical protein [Gammaproteobacteria bacterium]